MPATLSALPTAIILGAQAGALAAALGVMIGLVSRPWWGLGLAVATSLAATAILTALALAAGGLHPIWSWGPWVVRGSMLLAFGGAVLAWRRPLPTAAMVLVPLPLLPAAAALAQACWLNSSSTLVIAFGFTTGAALMQLLVMGPLAFWSAHLQPAARRRTLAVVLAGTAVVGAASA